MRFIGLLCLLTSVWVSAASDDASEDDGNAGTGLRLSAGGPSQVGPGVRSSDLGITYQETDVTIGLGAGSFSVVRHFTTSTTWKDVWTEPQRLGSRFRYATRRVRWSQRTVLRRAAPKKRPAEHAFSSQAAAPTRMSPRSLSPSSGPERAAGNTSGMGTGLKVSTTPRIDTALPRSGATTSHPLQPAYWALAVIRQASRTYRSLVGCSTVHRQSLAATRTLQTPRC